MKRQWAVLASQKPACLRETRVYRQDGIFVTKADSFQGFAGSAVALTLPCGMIFRHTLSLPPDGLLKRKPSRLHPTCRPYLVSTTARARRPHPWLASMDAQAWIHACSHGARDKWTDRLIYSDGPTHQTDWRAANTSSGPASADSIHGLLPTLQLPSTAPIRCLGSPRSGGATRFQHVGGRARGWLGRLPPGRRVPGEEAQGEGAHEERRGRHDKCSVTCCVQSGPEMRVNAHPHTTFARRWIDLSIDPSICR